jgi:protein pelota
LEKSKDILAEESMVREKKATDRFFNILGKTPDLAAYGEENVKKSAEMGAIELMLISDSNDEDKIEKFADLIEAQRGDWIIISSISREGQTLDGLGGIGAILRYKINW